MSTKQASQLSTTDQLSTNIIQTELSSLDSVPESVLAEAPAFSASSVPISVNTSEDFQKLIPIPEDSLSTDASSLFFPINLIVGTPNPDFLIGTNQSDYIFGRGGNDWIFGLGGNDFIYAGGGDDLAVGGAGNDSFRQWSGSEFVDGSGNDILVGGAGFDTADYRFLGQAVTLEASGKINKGKAGTDQIIDTEAIIGAIGKANAIDGSTGTGNASFDVDLSAKKLTVNGIPGIGSLNFTVENFLNVTGTPNNDSIVGDNKNNKFVGSQGDDFLSGGKGIDTADYSGLGQAITLEAAGVVDKGTAGTDKLLNINTIVGAVGRANTIDGSDGGTTSLDVNLAANKLTVKGIPNIGDSTFTVKNFVNVIGTDNNDQITGNYGANKLTGGEGDDKLSGLGGNDRLVGTSPSKELPGINEVDILTGGYSFTQATDIDSIDKAVLEGSEKGFQDLLTGDLVKTTALEANAADSFSIIPFWDRDTFVLGDGDTAYYQGGNTFFGVNDYAYITDFQSGVDKIELNGKSGDYLFLGSSLIFQNNGSSQLDPSDDLIGVVGGTGFTKSDLVFV